MKSSKKLFQYDNGSIETSLNKVIQEEMLRITFTSKVKTLKNMTAKEKREIEKTYNAKIAKPKKSKNSKKEKNKNERF